MWTQLHNGDGVELEDVSAVRFRPAETATSLTRDIGDRVVVTTVHASVAIQHVCYFDSAAEAIAYRDTLFAQVAEAKRSASGRAVSVKDAFRAFTASSEPDWVDGGDLKGDESGAHVRCPIAEEVKAALASAELPPSEADTPAFLEILRKSNGLSVTPSLDSILDEHTEPVVRGSELKIVKTWHDLPPQI